MKKAINSLILILIACVMVLAGCGSNGGLSDNPSTNATVYGNGGWAVIKGDYLYYVNGFVEDYQTTLSNYKTDNVYGKVTFGAIYRTKLSTYQLQKDDDGFLSSTQCVVSKVVGFENGSFYIIGDYIYYVTPHMEKGTGDSGALRNDLMSFNRIKIDGTGNKNFYVSNSTVTTSNWNMYQVDGKVYLAIIDSVDSTSTLKIIRASDGKQIFSKAITNSVLYDASDCGNIISEENGNLSCGYVYYTAALSDASTKAGYSGNSIYRVNIATGEETELVSSNDTYSMIATGNNKIYYTLAHTVSSTTTTKLYYQVTDGTFNNNTPQFITSESNTGYYLSDFNTDYLIAINGSNIIRYYNGTRLTIATDATSIKSVNGDYVYYLDSSSVIKKVNYTSSTGSTTGTNYTTTTDKTLLTDQYIDCDGVNVFVFAQYTAEDSTTHYYLNMITNGEDASFVGCFASGHTPAEPAEDSDTKWIV